MDYLLKKLAYISNMASPYQVRLCEHLQKYFRAEFWFYEYIAKSRPFWWKIELPESCKIIGNLLFKGNGRYLTFKVLRMLNRFDPDIVMLGGFTIPSNYISYLWAKKRGKKVIIFTETFRKNNTLRERNVMLSLVDILYKDVDAVFACHKQAVDQIRMLFNHLGRVTQEAHYSADIDKYFTHPIRKKKNAYNFIFPNRLIDAYNPVLAIDIFSEIIKRYPESRLIMNAQGDQQQECKKMITRLGIGQQVEFLYDIRHWDDLSRIYSQADILLFPAKFSNGNFTIIECMASGMGIVISDKILNHTELIRAGKNGFVCTPEKSTFLIAIQQYIDHPSLFQEHALLNREIAYPFSGAGTAELYARLINKSVWGC